MSDDNKLPWTTEQEHTIWMSFVIVANDRRAAYDKANEWCGKLGKTGSRPENCIEYVLDMVEREQFPNTARHKIAKQECTTCNATGDSNAAGMPCMDCAGTGYR